jgi:hypothetical protein
MIYLGNIYQTTWEVKETLLSALATTAATLLRVPHRPRLRCILCLEHDFAHTDIVDKQYIEIIRYISFLSAMYFNNSSASLHFQISKLIEGVT